MNLPLFLTRRVERRRIRKTAVSHIFNPSQILNYLNDFHDISEENYTSEIKQCQTSNSENQKENDEANLKPRDENYIRPDI